MSRRQRALGFVLLILVVMAMTDAAEAQTTANTSGLHGVVTDQTPEAGAKVPAGSPVRLWIERNGGAGVREPRRPKPTPRSGRALPPELSDEAVG